MPIENPCDPVNDCPCLEANRNYWQAAYIVDIGLKNYYQSQADTDSQNYYQFSSWMYQYGCMSGFASTDQKEPPGELSKDQQAELEKMAEEFRQKAIETVNGWLNPTAADSPES